MTMNLEGGSIAVVEKRHGRRQKMLNKMNKCTGMKNASI
jgi:hypothetical protein